MVRIIQTEELNSTNDFTDQAFNDWVYNGLDCTVTLEIADELRDQCDEVSEKIYKLSLALQAPSFEMTLRGIRVDEERLSTTLTTIRSQMEKLKNNFNMLVHDSFDTHIQWSSPQQLQRLFYTILGLKPIRKRNAHGMFVPTTNRDAVERLSVHFHAEPFCNYIIKLRELAKKEQFLSTKLDADGRMRANWNIAGTKTGRMASSESDFGTGTNNQNVDRNLRRAFIADPGMKFGNIDLEQADARNVGAICWSLFFEQYGPKFAGSYLDACESGDLHTLVCEMGWPHLNWRDALKATNKAVVAKENRAIADKIAYRNFSYRDQAKRLGHGSNYDGMTAVSRATKIPMNELKAFQDRYFKGFPCIPLWHEWVKNELRTVGAITTLWGRRRYFFGRPNDPNIIRPAIAYEPQSMTADEINHGMMALWKSGLVQILNQTHDSILFQYPEELEAEIIPAACDMLLQPLTLIGGREFVVPVEAKTGWNWGDQKVDPDTGIITNLHGLKKWKGSDDRHTPTYKKKSKRSFLRALHNED